MVIISLIRSAFRSLYVCDHFTLLTCINNNSTIKARDERPPTLINLLMVEFGGSLKVTFTIVRVTSIRPHCAQPALFRIKAKLSAKKPSNIHTGILLKEMKHKINVLTFMSTNQAVDGKDSGDKVTMT